MLIYPWWSPIFLKNCTESSETEMQEFCIHMQYIDARKWTAFNVMPQPKCKLGKFTSKLIHSTKPPSLLWTELKVLHNCTSASLKASLIHTIVVGNQIILLEAYIIGPLWCDAPIKTPCWGSIVMWCCYWPVTSRWSISPDSNSEYSWCNISLHGYALDDLYW